MMILESAGVDSFTACLSDDHVTCVTVEQVLPALTASLTYLLYVQSSHRAVKSECFFRILSVAMAVMITQLPECSSMLMNSPASPCMARLYLSNELN